MCHWLATLGYFQCIMGYFAGNGIVACYSRQLGFPASPEFHDATMFQMLGPCYKYGHRSWYRCSNTTAGKLKSAGLGVLIPVSIVVRPKQLPKSFSDILDEVYNAMAYVIVIWEHNLILW